jgi:hAT family C-terminal dimerisation region
VNFFNIRVLCNVISDSDGSRSPITILRCIYANHLNKDLPNLAIASRILLTIPVTVASAQRSFFKLKLIKTCFLARMTQERLVGLALMLIEHDVSSTFNYAHLIKQFVNAKAR